MRLRFGTLRPENNDARSLFGKHVTALKYVGSAETLLAVSGDRSVRRLTTSNGKILRTYTGSADFVHSLAVAQEIVIAGGEDGTVRVWNSVHGKPIATFSSNSSK